MNLFIDTNVLLDFYRYRTPEELRKLAHLLELGKITLFLPENVVAEVYRHREALITEHLEKLRKLSLPPTPGLLVELAESNAYEEARRTFESARHGLVEAFRAKALAEALTVDRGLRFVIDKSTPIATTDKVLEAAERRAKLKSPPGKDGNLGDPINWEALLSVFPKRQVNGQTTDLHVVSRDGDFRSPVDTSRPKLMLENEWFNLTGGRLTLHLGVQEFVDSVYPGRTGSAIDLRRDVAIEMFEQSGSYLRTHRAVAELGKFGKFKPAEVRRIVAAALSNRQIRDVLGDEDLQWFLRGLVRVYDGLLGESERKELSEALGIRASGSYTLTLTDSDTEVAIADKTASMEKDADESAKSDIWSEG